MMRTKGVAKLSAEDAIAIGASGPTLRGSGVDIDLRRDMPYTGYDNFKFKVPVGKERRRVRPIHVPGAGAARVDRDREAGARRHAVGPDQS